MDNLTECRNSLVPPADEKDKRSLFTLFQEHVFRICDGKEGFVIPAKSGTGIPQNKLLYTGDTIRNISITLRVPPRPDRRCEESCSLFP